MTLFSNMTQQELTELQQQRSVEITEVIDTIITDDLFMTPYDDSCYNEAEQLDTYNDLYGDDYADAMMSELGM